MTEIDNIELLDKFPYMQELCRRIDDVNNFINNGNSGLEQAWNLTSDLPEDWLYEIQPMIDEEIKKYQNEDLRIRALYKQHKITVNIRDRQLLSNEMKLSRKIKSITVGLLNKKKILLLTRRSIETNKPDIDMDFEQEDES